MSDPHASARPLREALEIFAGHDVDRIFCLGDIAGYGNELKETAALLISSHCQCIKGNHEAWYIDEAGDARDEIANYFKNLPTSIEMTIEGKKIYLVHASPPDDDKNGIRLLNEKGQIIDAEKKKWSGLIDKYDFDILIVGHTHQVFYEKVGKKLVINPGSTNFNHTCMIMSLPDMNVEIFSLSNKKPILAWNWSMMRTTI